MPRAGAGPDFIEALARGLEVIAAFRGGLRHDDASPRWPRPRAWPGRPHAGSCSRSSSSATSASQDGSYALTPRVLDLGVAYVRVAGAVGRRPPAHAGAGRPHRRVVLGGPARRLGHRLRRAGGRPEDRRPFRPDRHAVPGARRRRWARCCSPALPGRRAGGRARPADAVPGSSPRWQPDRAERDAALREVRARGWALTDEQLALGIRSVAAPLRDGTGRVIASVNVNVHAAETSVEKLVERAPAAAAGGGRARSAPTSRGSAAVPHETVAI